jgi:hypothetical protein
MHLVSSDYLLLQQARGINSQPSHYLITFGASQATRTQPQLIGHQGGLGNTLANALISTCY